jgi:triphosphoribosyl-dephospho-CoA synthase
MGALEETIARVVRRACILEASAEKPGNVTPTRSFHDTSYQDFVRSAEAVAPVLGRARELPVGALVLEAIAATRRSVGRNTNLGIVLLLAPLARAAASDEPSGATLRERLRAVLAELTLEDTHQVYEAIRLAAPGGLGAAPQHDVRDAPAVDLLMAMGSAAERDSIAREYVTGYAITFEVTAPALAEARRQGLAPGDAVVQAYLRLLAQVPDTLIARKRGRADAEQVSAEARRVLALGGLATVQGRAAISDLDTRLRDPRNTWNPGTSADLIAAGLFVSLMTTNEFVA